MVFERPIVDDVVAAFGRRPPLLQVLVVSDSLIETVLARDVFQLQAVTKPAFLRHLFALATQYPAERLSYNKMLGQLQDAGNTVTLAGYLQLLEVWWSGLKTGVPLDEPSAYHIPHPDAAIDVG